MQEIYGERGSKRSDSTGKQNTGQQLQTILFKKGKAQRQLWFVGRAYRSTHTGLLTSTPWLLALYVSSLGVCSPYPHPSCSKAANKAHHCCCYSYQMLLDWAGKLTVSGNE
uniref:Uncharacterized protein n=1 Tax=Ditylenchus dipsaci TaxID=166011 RepID=A0A915EN28_9BILA